MPAVTRTPTPDLLAGARELLRSCLAVTGDDRVLVITDRRTRPLADVIVAEARALTRAALAVVPEVTGDGYARARAEIGRVLDEHRPTVTVFAAADPGDLVAWDGTFWAHLDRLGARHAHMPALDDVCLGVGMAVDYAEVARFTLAVRDRLTGCRSVRITSATGTELDLTCAPERPWTPFTGLYGCAGEGGRLPQGEVFCTPVDAEGVLAVSVVGYPFNSATGLLPEPLLIEVAGGRAVSLRHPDRELESRLRDWLGGAPDGLRLGELALGTNRALTALTGNLLFDENVPGTHLAFGHPFPEFTGADWESPVHVDMVVARPDVRVDGETVLTDGTYAGPFGDN
ncbi:aminopeptidase [Streptomyces sp. NPDC004610]|uniref:aminopeptidase n=1 Tax=unclassified Streptomyces TaxID=2593676 RepID=UPI0033A04C99